MLLLAAIFVLYCWRLSDTPVGLHEAEVLFALHAKAIAETLHDANGRLLPLYVQMPQLGNNTWFHAMIVYAIAPWLKLLPLAEWTVRLATVFVGMANIVLIYAIARRVFDSERYGLLGGLLIALTPAHFIHSRLAMDYLYPVPFILTWLWCLVRFEEDAAPRWVFGGALALGVGMYSYIGAVALMPLYLLMTLVFLIHKFRAPHRTMLVAALGFCLPLILLAVWLVQYPDFVNETIVRYGISSNQKLHAFRSLLTAAKLEEDLATYWNLSSPVYLFLVGSANWVASTRTAGVFLMPMAVCMAAGLADFIIGPRSRFTWLVIAGLLTAPLGAVFVGEQWAIYRELELIPFAVLLAMFGVRRMELAVDRRWHIIGVAALALMPLQFAYFYYDYFTDYRLNSLAWFGPDYRGAVSYVVEQEGKRGAPPVVYISRSVPLAREFWEFHLAKQGREDLIARTSFFDRHTTPAEIPPGSILIEPLSDGRPLDPIAHSPELKRVGVLTKADGGPAMLLLERAFTRQ